MNTFASSYEVRMARILRKNGILFIYGESFIIERDGDVLRCRKVDFTLKNNWIWSDESKKFVKYIEVKGAHIDKRARIQHEELKEKGIDTVIFNKRKIVRCEKEKKFFVNLLKLAPTF